MVLLGSLGVVSAYDQVIDGILYNYVNGNTQELELVGFSESAINNKTVPQNLNLPMYPVAGKKLVEIGASAFRMNYTLNYFTSVKMPSSVRTIGARAFESVKLSQVDMSSTTVSNIPATCFQYCTASKILLPSTVTRIMPEAFAGCTNLTDLGNLNFGELTEISYRAFQNCSKLTVDVKLTKLWGSMMSQVFEGSNIRSLTIGSNVTATGGSMEPVESGF